MGDGKLEIDKRVDRVQEAILILAEMHGLETKAMIESVLKGETPVAQES